MSHEPLLLHIETSTDVCSVAFSQGYAIIGHALEREGRRHAALLPLMIEEARMASGVGISDLDAVCYSQGPGSYTGLRVGLSTAKGLCYALNKPLIAVPTLLALTYGIEYPERGSILVPMIDARRDEVYLEIYNAEREVLEASSPMILQEESFNKYLEAGYRLYLCGNGARKARDLIKSNEFLHFDAYEIDAKYMVKPGINCFLNKVFENLAYAVPEYLKAPAYKKAM
ncbi:MAG: tRNA (adenosine(37)-N6)-threonylcarbamoyltransferase complex dimerization subunit type 1 TsaB [Saprospiraceae bacterium]|nr:tRNA (adenosine(37)-N6)-threonylcarbamoyltransferase complex dimerization subunit type 1 TsaB [Saprospiraceae bacterium]